MTLVQAFVAIGTLLIVLALIFETSLLWRRVRELQDQVNRPVEVVYRPKPPAALIPGGRGFWAPGEEVVGSSGFAAWVVGGCKGVYTQSLGGIAQVLQVGAEKRIGDLMTIVTVDRSSDTIEYVKEASSEFFVRPTEGRMAAASLTFAVVSTEIQKLAFWWPITKTALLDHSSITSSVINHMARDTLPFVEDQVIAGTGPVKLGPELHTEELVGFMNHAGLIHVRPRPGAELELVRDAANLVESRGGQPYQMIVNIDQPEEDIPPVWGLEVIYTDGMPLGTIAVGDLSRAVLFDPEEVEISIAQSHDDFIRNLWRIQMTMPVGIGVGRPGAIAWANIP